ncbi:hypothetical protein MTP99_000808 [Tenebrio molitor]|nr:hypothetical protein MTP99_000808 [Tenebrio molitor]
MASVQESALTPTNPRTPVETWKISKREDLDEGVGSGVEGRGPVGGTGNPAFKRIVNRSPIQHGSDFRPLFGVQ